MEIVVQLPLFVAGLGLALVASDRAVAYTRALATALGAPPFIVGVVLVSVGTDLPEIANSIAAHLQGEGDVNVGDSVGSTLTQYTLVLGLFPLVAGAMLIDRLQVGLVTVLTMAGLVLTAAFVADGWLGRWEGLVLIAAWALATWIVVRVIPSGKPEDAPKVAFSSRWAQAGVVLGTLALVGLGATVAVRALVRIAEIAGVPEFVIAFFGASFGTSAPEIVVDFTALLRGAPAIALGDALGSSLVDATLSIGAGPLVAPAPVTARLALTGALYTLGAVAIVGALLGGRRRHDRLSMVVLLILYFLAYVVLLSAE
ncbi:MAG: sodium:calcium antiporter [Gaiellaceae bacterium]